MKKNDGFTLIELVTVIIIVGVLAVNVIPRFGATSSYEPHTQRAKLISSLRLTQQRAMQQTDSTDILDSTGAAVGYCHEIVFEDSRYGIPSRTSCTNSFPSNWQPDATGHIVDDRYNITFDVDGLSNPSSLGFDWKGRPTGDCAGGCVININHPTSESLKIYIEAEGYINVFDELH